jgi:hypothetical protein
MYPTNLERVVQLATEVFDVKNGSDQLDINPKVMGRLKNCIRQPFRNKLVTIARFAGFW